MIDPAVAEDVPEATTDAPPAADAVVTGDAPAGSITATPQMEHAR